MQPITKTITRRRLQKKICDFTDLKRSARRTAAGAVGCDDDLLRSWLVEGVAVGEPAVALEEGAGATAASGLVPAVPPDAGGDGAATVVEGEAAAVGDGDVVFTTAGEWACPAWV